jgi:hypothetical protein
MLMGNDRLRAAAKFETEQDAKASAIDSHCDVCNAEMTLLGILPPIRFQSAISVFRCEVCNNVISHEI